jgi:hypothetical protein
LWGRIRGCPSNPDAILDEPFVDGFRWMCHEDSSFEIGFGQYIGKRSRMVDVKTWMNVSNILQ